MKMQDNVSGVILYPCFPGILKYSMFIKRRLLFASHIDTICYGFQPYSRPLITARDCYLAESRICTCAMPVRNIWRAFDVISFTQYFPGLSFLLGVSAGAVSTWCRNFKQPSIEKLYEIARFLNVEATALLNPVDEIGE